MKYLIIKKIDNYSGESLLKQTWRGDGIIELKDRNEVTFYTTPKELKFLINNHYIKAL